MNKYPIVGERIRELRIEKHVSQQALGNALAVSQDTISLWENSKSLPPCEMIIALAKFFAVTSDFLLGLAEFY